MKTYGEVNSRRILISARAELHAVAGSPHFEPQTCKPKMKHYLIYTRYQFNSDSYQHVLFTNSYITKRKDLGSSVTQQHVHQSKIKISNVCKSPADYWFEKLGASP